MSDVPAPRPTVRRTVVGRVPVPGRDGAVFVAETVSRSWVAPPPRVGDPSVAFAAPTAVEISRVPPLPDGSTDLGAVTPAVAEQVAALYAEAAKAAREADAARRGASASVDRAAG